MFGFTRSIINCIFEKEKKRKSKAKEFEHARRTVFNTYLVVLKQVLKLSHRLACSSLQVPVKFNFSKLPAVCRQMVCFRGGWEYAYLKRKVHGIHC